MDIISPRQSETETETQLRFNADLSDFSENEDLNPVISAQTNTEKKNNASPPITNTTPEKIFLVLYQPVLPQPWTSGIAGRPCGYAFAYNT
ncbi:unnamed protein product [Larinioides sclopetarius]|uniref:Uncharacterized protein n=1 Tax=Larinioides sclopetarius TaxID=280406 RepID=A0AAV2BXC9_9ARAC